MPSIHIASLVGRETDEPDIRMRPQLLVATIDEEIYGVPEALARAIVISFDDSSALFHVRDSLTD